MSDVTWRLREPAHGLAPSAGARAHESPSAEVFQRVLGAARAKHSSEGFTVCLWSAEQLDQYNLPATNELVVNLHTGGAPVRTRLPSGWTRDMAPGRVHVMPPSVATTWKAGRDLSFVSIHFPVNRIEALAEDSSQSRRWIENLRFRFGVEDPLVAAATSALAREVRDPGEQTALFADHLADTILLHVLRTGRGTEPETRRQWQGGLSPRAIRIVREKFAEDLTVGMTIEDLSREVGLSRAHFARAFKISMGMPPHHYVTACRVARAKDLLAKTDAPLADIALEVGFSSQAHFTNRFRGFSEQTPGQYRRSVRRVP
jgi:AraC family transcriptional regulator